MEVAVKDQHYGIMEKLCMNVLTRSVALYGQHVVWVEAEHEDFVVSSAEQLPLRSVNTKSCHREIKRRNPSPRDCFGLSPLQ